MKSPDFVILEEIGSYEKLMRHLGNLRHFQREYEKGEPVKAKKEMFEKKLDRYIEEYFKPIKALKEKNG